MEKSVAKIRQEYKDEIRVIESNIKDVASGEASNEVLEHSQRKLDRLAKKFQYSDQIGNAQYKLYELQALIHYYNHQDDDAMAFIEQAIETKGSTYKRAEQLIEQLESGPHLSSVDQRGHQTDELPLELQSLIKGTRTSAIIMAILAFISIYFIPWGIFYIVMATKLKPDKVPSRKLIKGAAIATLPLCTAIIPIFIDIEFWRMNRRLKEFEEKGAGAFKSDEEFLEGEPKRKKRNTIAWSILIAIIVLFVILIIVAIASSSDNSTNYNPTSNTNYGNSSNSSQVDEAYRRMEGLRSQYNTCSSDLEARYNTINTYSDYEVDSYNRDYDECENTRIRLNNTVDEYNRLAGFE
jgi:uncharacterized membrane protein